MTAPLTVDVTGWFITALTGHVGARVGSNTPADLEQQLPFVRVLRIGGPDDGYVLDIPSMAFHCYAADDPAANQLGYAVKAAVYGLRGVVHAGAVLTSARTFSGPSWAPTENQNIGHAVLLMQGRIKFD